MAKEEIATTQVETPNGAVQKKDATRQRRRKKSKKQREQELAEYKKVKEKITMIIIIFLFNKPFINRII